MKSIVNEADSSVLIQLFWDGSPTLGNYLVGLLKDLSIRFAPPSYTHISGSILIKGDIAKVVAKLNGSSIPGKCNLMVDSEKNRILFIGVSLIHLFRDNTYVRTVMVNSQPRLLDSLVGFCFYEGSTQKHTYTVLSTHPEDGETYSPYYHQLGFSQEYQKHEDGTCSHSCMWKEEPYSNGNYEKLVALLPETLR